MWRVVGQGKDAVRAAKEVVSTALRKGSRGPSSKNRAGEGWGGGRVGGGAVGGKEDAGHVFC